MAVAVLLRYVNGYDYVYDYVYDTNAGICLVRELTFSNAASPLLKVLYSVSNQSIFWQGGIARPEITKVRENNLL